MKSEKLTIEDLDRFLAMPVESGAEPGEPAMEDTGSMDLIPYFNAAAVLAAFDPFMIRPVSGAATAHEREGLLDHLLPACEQITAGPQQGLWSLSFAERRTVLRRLATQQ